jgi:hypothetical protein
MLGHLALCGAAAIALATLFPAHSPAKGFLGAPMHHSGAFLSHFHFNRHGHDQRFGHRGHGHRNSGNGHGDGYAYWPLGFDYGNDAPAPEFVPLAYPVYLGPRCAHSVETVVVPAELGGERAIRITRC